MLQLPISNCIHQTAAAQRTETMSFSPPGCGARFAIYAALWFYPIEQLPTTTLAGCQQGLPGSGCALNHYLMFSSGTNFEQTFLLNLFYCFLPFQFNFGIFNCVQVWFCNLIYYLIIIFNPNTRETFTPNNSKSLADSKPY